MNTRPLPKAVLYASFAAVALAFAVQLLLPPGTAIIHGCGGVDYNVYRAAAQVVLGGESLYDRALTHSPELGFTYPPFAVLAFLPMAVFPRLIGEGTHLVISILALALVIGRTLEFMGFRRDRALVLSSIAFSIGAVNLEPVQSTLWFGQLNIVLMALVFLDLLGPQSSRWRGFGVGLAAGLKLTPLVFVPYLLLTKQWRAAATAALTFLGTIALGFLVVPHDSVKFWSSVGQTTRVGPLAWPSNQAVEGTLARIWAPHDAPKALFYALALVLGGAGLLLGAYAYRRSERLLAVVVVGLVACVVSPIAWSHHWVWAAPLVVWLVVKAVPDENAAPDGKSGPKTAWALAAAGLYLWVFVWPNNQSSLSFDRSMEPASIGVFWLQHGPPLLRDAFGAWYLYAYLAILFFSWRSLRQKTPA
ncbi:MAG: glycosyltransferase 87 family protein [Segniliparus sp.]|uniref:glycosyltransferase 87 family protein n=1 Tax=Segniliparus sp. TaxID=2804064 RepID=UPI003F3C081B